jgi:hypothetical protein
MGSQGFGRKMHWPKRKQRFKICIVLEGHALANGKTVICVKGHLVCEKHSEDVRWEESKSQVDGGDELVDRTVRRLEYLHWKQAKFKINFKNMQKKTLRLNSKW